MKKIYIILIVLLVVVGDLYFVLNNPVGRLAQMAIEELAPKITQAEVRVGSVKISAADGQGEIDGLMLGNPKGFKTKYAFKADRILVGIEPASVIENVVVIRKVQIDAPQINYEKGEKESNFDAIQHNVEQYAGAGNEDKKDKDAAKKLIIDSLVIHDAKVSYGGSTPLTLPDIELHNIGKDTGGATSAQVVRELVGELLKQMALAIPKTIESGVKSAVNSLFGK